MLPIAGYAPLNGWKQVGSPDWALMSAHVFEATDAGELAHYTDGRLRAIVPPEGFAEYLALWPMAEPIVAQLTRKSPAPEAPADAQAGE